MLTITTDDEKVCMLSVVYETNMDNKSIQTIVLKLECTNH